MQNLPRLTQYPGIITQIPPLVAAGSVKLSTMASNKPKRPGSAFLLFSNDMRPKYKAEHPNASVTEVSAGLGELWKTLAPKEKEKYNSMYQKLKSQYDSELQYYMDHRTEEDIANEEKAKGKGKRGKGEEKKKKMKDPNAPKRPLSGYMFFTQDIRPTLQNMSVTEQAKELGARWAMLTDAQKEKYNKLAEKDKKRYHDEMAEYKHE